jgi:hypothetical protein
MKMTKQPKLAEFKRWAKSHTKLAEAVCLAQAFAECQRERVDAYITPIFQRYAFQYSGELIGNLSGPLPSQGDLYLCEDPRIGDYYEECDRAHRAHGFNGPHGQCPALVAEHLLIKAQNALIDAAIPLFGVECYMMSTEQRTKYLDLLLGACLIKEAA